MSLENIGSAHGDCNINLKLNCKISVLFLNLKNYNSHVIMQELSQCSFKINVKPNVLEKYLNFTINNKLFFIDSFQFQRSSLNSSAKNLDKDHFRHLNQEFDKNMLDLV